LLESDEKYGFIVMDGNGSLFGQLAGSNRVVLHKFSVDLPKKHGRGGQSALRFARLRLEKRHNYVRKVAEMATQMFITNDKPNVTGLVLAGSAEFKSKLAGSDLFDGRLSAIVIKMVDVSYGGLNGFNQAIDLAAESLANVKFIREMKLLSGYFGEISRDTGKVCYGVRDTLYALESGAIDNLIVYENLAVQRFTLQHPQTREEKIMHKTDKEVEDNTSVFTLDDGTELEVKEKQPLLEWFAENFKDFGAKLHFVTNKSQEGSQFCRGFGGIGGTLRYVLDFADLDACEEADDEEFGL